MAVELTIWENERTLTHKWIGLAGKTMEASLLGGREEAHKLCIDIAPGDLNRLSRKQCDIT